MNKGGGVMSEARSPRVLDVDIDYIMGLDDDCVVTAFKSDAIYDIPDGWYAIRGKIFYSDGNFDYYNIKVYRRKVLDEYCRRIRCRG